MADDDSESAAINKCNRVGGIKLSIAAVLLLLLAFYAYTNEEFLKVKHFTLWGRAAPGLPNCTVLAEDPGDEFLDAAALRPRMFCNCGNSLKMYVKWNTSEECFELQKNSTCSPEATEMGLDQQVISYAYYIGNKKRDFVKDLEEILGLTRKFYPGWYVRLYTSQVHLKKYCDLVCKNQDLLFYCPIEYMERFCRGTNITKVYPRQWRFLVLGDPTVERFQSRDLDSRPIQREVDALDDWGNSSFPFHVMRDFIWHNSHAIMAGMWDGDNSRLEEDEAVRIGHDITYYKNSGMDGDQLSLQELLYKPGIKNKTILIHDSYFCGKRKDSVPFPTRRTNRSEWIARTVGKGYPPDGSPVCPVECRPTFGKDWLYC